MSKTPFQFPIRAGDIEEFCHPDPDHVLGKPYMIAGELTAGNGYFAIKAARGLWMDSDFTPAPAEAIERFSNLPWHSFPDPKSLEWRNLDDVRGDIYRFATIKPWTEQHKPTPTPIWKVGASHLVRLSHLQMIARLPGCRVYCGLNARFSPLFFTFNGGSLIVPLQKNLTTSSWQIFAPIYDPMTGKREERRAPAKFNFALPPTPEPPIDGWPPVEIDEP